jgi:hypothetical protein
MNQTVKFTPVPGNELKPPSYGAPRRDAINSLVDDLVSEVCKKIEAVRETLNAIEQQALESAANSKHALQDHVSVCVRLDDEISHMRKVVEDIKAAAPK